ncbi:MAG: hypothetical protein CNCCGFBP_00315 [Fimbriimonadaceae bacterium]|nr:hypothetical protein [Fimbriimonadaceae bacterium]
MRIRARPKGTTFHYGEIAVGHGVRVAGSSEAEERDLCSCSLQRSNRFKIGLLHPKLHNLRPSHCRGRGFESHHLHQVQMNLNGS